MVSLDEGLDPRVVYSVMLNATEGSSLSEILDDLAPRGFVSEGELIDATRSAVSFLLGRGWVSLLDGAFGDGRDVPTSEAARVLDELSSWKTDANGGPFPVELLSTKSGIEEWGEGFPVVGLSEEERRALMFPQYYGSAGV